MSFEDAPIIVDTWDDSDFDYYSVAQVRFCIEHLPSLGKSLFCVCVDENENSKCLIASLFTGAYHHGKLLCWRITYYDGSSDMAFTLPEARRLGLSYQVGVRLASEVCKIQRGSFGYVAQGNQASLAMVTKMGYRITCQSDWIEFEPNSIRNEKAVSSLCQQTKHEFPLKFKSSI